MLAVQHPLNAFYMFFSLAFSIDENVIKVYNNKDVKLFCQNLVNIILESGWYISQSKKHYLIFEIAIASYQGRFLFIAISNPYLMVGIS